MKKILAMAAAAAMMLGTAAELPITLGQNIAVQAADYTEGTYELLTYENYGDFIVITDCDMLATEVEIPSAIDGVPVTMIGKSAFIGCEILTSIVIPDSVTSIGDTAFHSCESLTSITIPNSVTSIGDNAFFGCEDLTEIYVADGNTYYTSSDGILFSVDMDRLVQYPAGKSDETYAIPDSVTSIGTRAFDSCYRLTSITIPNSVTSIGYSAFHNCESLTSITIPNSVTNIDDSAFNWCSNLTSVTLSNSVTSIGSYAFSNCSSLTSITIPDNVTSIEYMTFNACKSLTSITIPNSVTSISYGAFYECENLTDIYYSGSEEEWNAITISDDNDALTSATIHYNAAPAVDLGDLNADSKIDASDAAALLMASAAIGVGEDSGLIETQLAAAELNGDGKVDALDAAAILQYAAYTGVGGTQTIEEFLAENQ